MNLFYYLCSYPLELGSVILPGNWGRIIRKYLINTPNFILQREFIIESVRLKEYSNMPSRLECLFLFKNKLDAETLRDQQRKVDILYEVKLLEPEKRYYELDMAQVNQLNTPISTEKAEEIIHNYWAKIKTGAPLIEILTMSKIEVIQRF